MHLPLALLVALQTPAATPESGHQPDSTLLRVIAIADLHGALAPRSWPWSNGRAVGGVAALKVWVIGLTTTSTPTTTAPRNVRGLAFGDGAIAIQRELRCARGAADFVVVLAHEGAVCDSGACRGAILDVARGLDSASVDLIVAGHTHRVVNTIVNGIPVVEAGSSGDAVAVVDFVRVGNRRDVRARIDTPYVDRVTPDLALTTLVARYQRAVDGVTSRQVATLRYVLLRESGEYGLGRLLADAYRNIARADAGLVNNAR